MQSIFGKSCFGGVVGKVPDWSVFVPRSSLENTLPAHRGCLPPQVIPNRKCNAFPFLPKHLGCTVVITCSLRWESKSNRNFFYQHDFMSGGLTLIIGRSNTTLFFFPVLIKWRIFTTSLEESILQLLSALPDLHTPCSCIWDNY